MTKRTAYPIAVLVEAVRRQCGDRLSQELVGPYEGVAVRSIGALSHGIGVSSSPKDLETAFQLLYLTFMEPRFDESEFETGMAQLRALLPNVENQPSFKLQKEMNKDFCFKSLLPFIQSMKVSRSMN